MLAYLKNHLTSDLQRRLTGVERLLDQRTAERDEALAERDQTLAQQTATSEVLQVINASPGDPQPVFDAMLEKALLLCEAAFGSLLRFDGQFFRRAAIRNFPPPLAERNQPIPPFPGSALERLTRGEPFAMIEDITVDQITRSGDAGRLAMTAPGARTAIWVALRKDNKLLGAFVAYRQEIRLFSEKQIALLQNFAAQAVIAMENARLLAETREALEQQTAIGEVLRAISSSALDLEPVLQSVVSTAMRLCRADEAVLYRNIGGEYRWAAGKSLAPAYESIERGIQIRPGIGTLVGRTALWAQTVQIIDCQTDPDYEAKNDARIGGIHTLLGVPLLRDGAPIGVVGLARRRVEAYNDREIELVRTFADQAVIAIENARLITETREALEQQTATAEVLQVINSTPGDLAPVFEALLEKAHQLCEASFGALMRFDGERFYPVAVQGVPAEFRQFIGDGIRPSSGNPFARMVEGEPFSHVHDLSEVAAAFPDEPLPRAAVELGGITAYRQEVRPFTTKQIALLQNFAAQAVIAMENARLITETREARDAAETALRNLQAAQTSLVQAQKMAALGQLTAGIAHEIKNPLNFVNNFAGLSIELLDELKESAAPGIAMLDEDTRANVDETVEMLTRNLDKIAEHGTRADNIVKSMLEHSRGVSGERRAVDLNALVDDALNLAYHGARAQDQNFNITLERDFENGLAPIELAPQEVTRVFLNLINNGFYAATKGKERSVGAAFKPTLAVTTREADNAVEITVRDNGTGIPPEIKDKLF